MPRRIAIPCALVLLTGCASLTHESESRALETTLVAYGNAIRWGDIQQALPFVDPETVKTHPLTPLDLQRYKQVRFVSYIEQAPVPAGPHQVRQVVKIGLLNVNTQTERDIVDNQLWRYDEASKHWHIVSGLPDITQGRTD
jgi:hypothetical protein